MRELPEPHLHRSHHQLMVLPNLPGAANGPLESGPRDLSDASQRGPREGVLGMAWVGWLLRLCWLPLVFVGYVTWGYLVCHSVGVVDLSVGLELDLARNRRCETGTARGEQMGTFS